MTRINTVLVRDTREELGMTQAALATEVGVTQWMVSHWESGRVVPTFANGVAWARALHLDPEDLLTDEPRGATS